MECSVLEQNAAAQGVLCCGVDEAGRGPLAGPVVAAAVLLPPDFCPDGLNDSKKLTERARERLYGEILASCAVGVGTADEREIDERNILRAPFHAMQRAVDALRASASGERRGEAGDVPGGDVRLAPSFCPASSGFCPGLPGLALVDGNRDPGLLCAGVPLQTRTVVHGDALCPCIAAASVVAKVTRDRFMTRLDRAYPQYGFAVHKGYPTRAHYDAVAQYGVSPVHRRSFFAKRPALLDVPYREPQP